MRYINLVAFMMVILFLGIYYLMKKEYINEKRTGKSVIDEKIGIAVFWLILAVGLLIRVICGYHYKGHPDMGCFNYWANVVYENGFSKFYDAASFADYPPGYMYVLYVVAWLKDIFSVADGTSMGALFVKSPAIILDIVTGFIIYIIAKKKNTGWMPVICFAMYILNPVVILNSSVWGQVDSVFGLGIFLMCYFVYDNKTKYAYISYFIALLIKPQAIMFTPIIMYAAAEEVFVSRDEKDKCIFKFNLKALLEQLAWFIGSIIIAVLIMIPFGFERVIKQYTETLASYEYATVNAYNMWSMFGLGWVSQDELACGLTYAQWGTVFIVCIVFVSFMIWLFKMKNKDRYFICAIFISAAMFTLSVRMHERYIYPAVILLLWLFVINKHVKVYWLYAVFSIAHFYNAAHVLFFYDANNFNGRSFAIISISMLQCLVFGFFMIYCYKNYIRENNADFEEITIEDIALKGLIKGKYNMDEKTLNDAENVASNEESANKEEPRENEIKDNVINVWFKNRFTKNTIKKSKVFEKITKIDIGIILIIMAIYSFFALRDLGDKSAPESFYEVDAQTSEEYAHIIIEVEDGTTIGDLSFYLGNYEERLFAVYTSNDGSNWNKLENSGYTTEEGVTENDTYEMHSVFCWNKWSINEETKYLQLVARDSKCVIGELVLTDTSGNIITPVNANNDSLKGLFDEQDEYPDKFSFRNSTYFDEIYHARSAYEFIKGIYCYEWTHPPLGKVFISLGMRIFGVCPFGWRIAGTVFGILMIPGIYLFAKRLFNKKFLATIACLLFTFDFMHFAQTRIATIDVFVTFFIIWMYYYMYKYYSMSFYDKKLTKTFVPLLCCGIATGCGMASKWTGVYAAGGLAIIFFYTMYRRYSEYRYALKHPAGSTNGIEHQHIIDVFKKNFWKTILFCVGVFIVIPAIIYTLSYIPFVPVNEAPKDLIGRMLYNQKQMFEYHSNIVFEHPFASSWYEWPLIIRPIYYYSGVLEGTMREGISAFGNPFVWWVGMPAFVYIIYRWWIKKDKMALFLGIGYLAQLLPWILVTRLTFIYHYFPSVPFVVLMIVFCIYRFMQQEKENNKKWIIAASIYTVLVVILFIMFYPVLSGQPVSSEYVYRWLKWLNTWVLIS